MMTDKKKPTWLPDWTDLLICAGALANISLWIRAGEMVESGGWSFISSLSLGFAMSLGPVQIIKKWSLLKPSLERTVKGITTSRPNPRWWVAIGAFSIILSSEAVLLSPVIMAMLSEKSLLEVLGTYALAWSFGRVLVSAIAVAGLAAVTGAHSQKSEEITPRKPALATLESESAPHSAPVSNKVRCTEPGCGIEYVWPNGKGAHYKKYHAPVRVDETLLLRKDGAK